MHFTLPSGEIKDVHDVLYVPGLAKNLLSIGSFADRGMVACFDENKCILYSKNHKQIVAEGTRNHNNGLYRLSARNLDITAGIVHADINTVRLWHYRLGHIGFDRLHDLSAKNMVTGIPSIPTHREVCTGCQLGKQSRQSFPRQSEHRATRPLELIHIDLCGPLPIASASGSRYIFVIIDDYSRYIWVYFLKDKSSTFQIFRTFKIMIELQLHSKIEMIRSDRGGEFISEDFSKLCEETGMRRQFTNARTPEQNGVVERANRKLLETARCMALQAKTPQFLWTEAVNTAAFIINRSPTSAIPSQVTPFQQLFHKKPDVSFLRIYGSRVHVWVENRDRNKLEPKAKLGLFVGYDSQTKGYRIWIPSDHKLVVTRNVRFDESSVFEKTTVLNHESPSVCLPTVPLAAENILMPSPIRQSILEPQQPNFEPIDRPEVIEPVDRETEKISEPTVPTTSCSQADSPHPLNTPQDLPEIKIRPTRTRQPSVRLRDSVTYSCDRVSTFLNSTSPQPTIDFIEFHKPVELDCFFGVVEEPADPVSFREANLHLGWREAMQSEKDSLLRNNTWEICDRPKGITPVTARWVYKTKIGPDGKPTKLKARLVARGYQQTKGIDFDEVFAPVAKWKAVRMIVALSASNEWILIHLDVKTAFLNGDLQEIVFMEVPEGFQNLSTQDKVCRLKKSLYGLRQAPRAWFEKINSFLEELGLSRTEADYSLFHFIDKGDIIILVLYVDDLLITGSNPTRVTELKTKLMKRFEMTDLGNVSLYLGVEFLRTQNGIFLSQRTYATQILREFGMMECTPASVPMIEGSCLDKEEDSPCVDAKQFQRLIGRLIYLVNTKPEILFATGVLSHSCTTPNTASRSGKSCVTIHQGRTGLWNLL